MGSLERELEASRQALIKAERKINFHKESAKGWMEEANKAERRRIAQKAATTRLRNRAKTGLCPCCNRHFRAHPGNGEVMWSWRKKSLSLKYSMSRNP